MRSTSTSYHSVLVLSRSSNNPIPLEGILHIEIIAVEIVIVFSNLWMIISGLFCHLLPIAARLHQFDHGYYHFFGYCNFSLCQTIPVWKGMTYNDVVIKNFIKVSSRVFSSFCGNLHALCVVRYVSIPGQQDCSLQHS